MIRFVMQVRSVIKDLNLNLGWNESLNKDLSYGVSFLGTYNKNEVVEMGGRIAGNYRWDDSWRNLYEQNVGRLSYRWFLVDSY